MESGEGGADAVGPAAVGALRSRSDVLQPALELVVGRVDGQAGLVRGNGVVEAL